MEILKLSWYILRRRWPIVLVALMIAMVGGVAYGSSQSTSYTATTTMFLRAPDVKTSASAYQGDLFSRQRAQSYLTMIKSDDLAQTVIDKLGLTDTPTALASKVSATNVDKTVVMQIAATDADPQAAADIANGYASVFGKYIAKIENVENDPNVPPLVTVINTATADGATRSGYPLGLILTLAAVLALMVSAAILWFLEYFDTTLRSRGQIEEISDAPVLADFGNQIGGNELGGSQGVDFASAELPPALAEVAEGFAVAARSRASVVGAVPDEGGLAIAAIADRPETSGSVVSAVFAEGLAASGASVSVLSLTSDGAEMFGDNESHGNIDLVSMPIGQTDERALAEALERLRTKTDYVVIDAPSLTTPIGAQIAMSMADAVVLAVAPTLSTRVALIDAVRTVSTLGTPLLGVVTTHAAPTDTLAGIYV